MAELTPLPTAQRPTDGGYQPISGYAVAAGVATIIFVLVLVVVFISAIGAQRSVMSYELLLLPIVGFFLSIAARSHIKRSEGTRSGLNISSAAWWICVLGGAGYAAYLYGNEFFIEWESRQFAEKFFEQLKAKKTRHAYQYLIEPAQREAASPDDPDTFDAQFASGFGPFRNHEFVRQLTRNADNLQLSHVTSLDLGQEPEGFKATHLFRATTAEGVFDLRLGLKAAEAKKGGKPVWRINARPNMAISIKPEQLSQYGRLVQELDVEGTAIVRNWANLLLRGATLRAHLFTLPGAERQALEQGIFKTALLGGGPGTIWNLTPDLLPTERRQAVQKLLAANPDVSKSPDKLAQFVAIEDLLNIEFFKPRDGGAPFSTENIEKLRQLWKTPALTFMAVDRPLPQNILMSEATRIEVTPERIRITIPMDWNAIETRGFYRASVTIETTDAEVLKVVNEAKQKGAKAVDDSTLTLKNVPNRNWQVVSLQTDLELILPVPGGPGRP